MNTIAKDTKVYIVFNYLLLVLSFGQLKQLFIRAGGKIVLALSMALNEKISKKCIEKCIVLLAVN